MSSEISKKDLLLPFLISLIIVIIVTFISLSDNQTRIVFCDVGQGDAAYIRIKNKFDILIDGGPDQSVMSCLGKYMPFYDKKIEMVILSHPEKDHYGGLTYLITRYKVDRLMTGKINFQTKTFVNLLKKITQAKINLISLDQIKIYDILHDRLELFPQKTSTINESSMLVFFEENNTKVLFTGDYDFKVMPANLVIDPVSILKVPHHGSKNGLTEKILKITRPKIAVISVGRNNSYGHPAKKIIDLLKKYGVKTRRTDEEGNIVFKI